MDWKAIMVFTTSLRDQAPWQKCDFLTAMHYAETQQKLSVLPVAKAY